MARLLLILALCGIIASPLAAHDLLPPDWRGLQGATYQSWTFDDADNPAEPESINNDFGAAIATIDVDVLGSGWLAEATGFGSQTGVWDIGPGGTITLDIANRDLPLGYKDIWIQLTYFEDGLIPAPAVDVIGAELLADRTETMSVEHTEPFGDWLMQKTVWRIYPNPLSEQIVITADPDWTAMIDQVVVDTICVPEPATLGILVFGTIMLLRKRRP